MPSYDLNVNRPLPGRNGTLFDDSGNLLANIPEFTVQVNIKNSDYLAAGRSIEQAVFQSYSVTLTFTETVVNDAVLLKKLLDMLKTGKAMFANFQGKIDGLDSDAERLTYRSCVPDGSIDLQNIKPGDIISRAWNWRVNEPPEVNQLLRATS